jgi:hypothetical protein
VAEKLWTARLEGQGREGEGEGERKPLTAPASSARPTTVTVTISVPPFTAGAGPGGEGMGLIQAPGRPVTVGYGALGGVAVAGEETYAPLCRRTHLEDDNLLIGSPPHYVG